MAHAQQSGIGGGFYLLLEIHARLMGGDPEMSGIQTQRRIQRVHVAEEHVHFVKSGEIVFLHDQKTGEPFPDQLHVPAEEFITFDEFGLAGEIAVEHFPRITGKFGTVKGLHAFDVGFAVAESFGGEIAHHRGVKDHFMDAEFLEFREIPVHGGQGVADLFPRQVPKTVLIERSVHAERDAFFCQGLNDPGWSGVVELDAEFPAERSRAVPAAFQFFLPVFSVKGGRSKMYFHVEALFWFFASRNIVPENHFSRWNSGFFIYFKKIYGQSYK